MKLKFTNPKPKMTFVKILASVAFVIGVGYIAGRLQKKGLLVAAKAVKDAIPTPSAG